MSGQLIFVAGREACPPVLHRGEDEEDLVQVAYTGLVEACLRFDPHQGSFVGFAEPTITGVLKRHFRDHGWTVRPPRPTPGARIDHLATVADVSSGNGCTALRTRSGP